MLGFFLFVLGVLFGEPSDVVIQETFYVKRFHMILMVNLMCGAVGQTTMEPPAAFYENANIMDNM